MKRFILSLLLTALCLPLSAQVAVKYNGSNGRRTEPADLKTPTGMAETFEAGSTLTINGVFSGTPSGGTLNLGNVTVTGLPSSGGTWGSITGTLSNQTDLQSALDLKLTAATAATTYQPLDSDLTAIAALSTTSFGRSVLALADAAALRTLGGLGTLATQSGTFSGTSSGTNTGDQTITLTGDVTGSGTGSFAATIAANSVALTTDTTGDYVATITGDSEITVIGTGTEGRAVTLAIGGAIARDSELSAVSAALVAVNASGVNTDGLVEWSQLVGVPAGFADGTDDGGGSGEEKWEGAFDGQGAVVASGVIVYRGVVATGTITSAALIGDAAGAITLTVKKYTPAGGALGSATTLGTIALSSAQHNRSTGLSWAVTAGDVIEVSTGGTISTVTRVNWQLSN